MTLQKWIKDRAIHGYPTFSIEDVRESGMYSSEQILQNELSRLISLHREKNVWANHYACSVLITIVKPIVRLTNQ
jgi:hypothetical protein